MIPIVYFSNVSNNTKRFVEKLGIDAQRIPVLPKEPELLVTKPYVLITPTYGGGTHGAKGAVPVQVKRFLSNERNRSLALGVISSGNMNFGEHFAIAGDVISAKLNIPFLYRFEILGTPADVEAVQEGLSKFYNTGVSI